MSLTPLPRAFLLAFLLAPMATTCGGSPLTPAAPAPGPPPGADPCASASLPPCPQACPGTPGALAGQPCAAQTSCGNDIGDGCHCENGIWMCQVHAPLGGPGACDLVCRGAAPNAGSSNAGGYNPCAGKRCGDPCTLCQPNDPGCVETMVLKVCNAQGQCSQEQPSCG